MKKILFTAFICAGLVISGAVSAADFPAPTLYGRVHISAGYVDNEDGSVGQMESWASRFGIKGNYQLDSNLTATYKLEFQVDTTDNPKSSSNHIKGRNQYAGLKGSFGEIRLGRHDTAYKGATAKLDPWSDSYADYTNIIDSTHDKRADDTIIYLNKFENFSFSLSHSFENDTPAGNGDGSVTGLGVNYKTEGLLLAGGIQDIDQDSTALKLGASYKFNIVTIGGLIESIDADDSTEDETNLHLAASFKITDKGSIKAIYGQSDIEDSEDQSLFGLGYEHKFNKKASIYLLAASSKNDGMSKSGVSEDATTVSAAIKFNF